MMNIPKYKTTKTLKEIKARSISNQEVMKGYTSKQRKEIKAKERYYKLLMNLRKSRERRGLTQKQVSIKSGVPVETISRLENCRRDALLETVVSIADALGLKTLRLS